MFIHLERAARRPVVPNWAGMVLVSWAGLVGLVTWLDRLHPGVAPPLCLFRRFTGLPCPTCGSTRMVLDLASGRWQEAIAWNPLAFVMLVGLATLLLIRVVLRRHVRFITSSARANLATATIVAALVLNWVYVLLTQA